MACWATCAPDTLDFIIANCYRSDVRNLFAVNRAWRHAAKRTLESKAWQRQHLLSVMLLPKAEQAYCDKVFLHPDDSACGGDEPGQTFRSAPRRRFERVPDALKTL